MKIYSRDGSFIELELNKLEQAVIAFTDAQGLFDELYKDVEQMCRDVADRMDAKKKEAQSRMQEIAELEKKDPSPVWEAALLEEQIEQQDAIDNQPPWQRQLAAYNPGAAGKMHPNELKRLKSRLDELRGTIALYGITDPLAAEYGLCRLLLSQSKPTNRENADLQRMQRKLSDAASSYDAAVKELDAAIGATRATLDTIKKKTTQSEVTKSRYVYRDSADRKIEQLRSGT